MVMGHIDFGTRFNVYIHAFHMPLFIVVAGFFFNPRRNYREYLVHDLRTLILPYTVFFLFCQLLCLLHTGRLDFHYAAESYFNSASRPISFSGALWFLLCLFSCKELYYWVKRLTKGIAFAVAILTLTFLGSFLSTIPIKLPLCLDSALSCLAFLWIGEILKRRQEGALTKKLLNLPFWLLVLVALANARLIFVNGSVNVRLNEWGTIPLYWANCLIALLCWANASKMIFAMRWRPIRFIVKELQYIGRESIAYLTINEILIFFAFDFFTAVGIPTDNVPSRFLRLIAVLYLIKGLRILSAKTKLDFIWGRTGDRS